MRPWKWDDQCIHAKTLLAAYPDLAIHIIDEAHSTEEARQLYWKLHPPKGLMKLIPLGMRTPPGNMDGLAAVILVQRYLSSKNRVIPLTVVGQRDFLGSLSNVGPQSGKATG